MSFTTSDFHAIQIDQTGKIIDTVKDVSLAGFAHDGRWITYNQNGRAENTESRAENLKGIPQHLTSTDEMTLLTMKKPDFGGVISIWKNTNELDSYQRDNDSKQPFWIELCWAAQTERYSF